MRGNQSGLKAMEKNHPNMYGCKIWMFVWGKEFYKSLGEGGFQFTESNHSIFFLHSGSPFTMIFGSSTMVICLCRLLQGDVQIWKNGGLKPIMMRSLSPHFSSVWLFAGAYLSSSQKKHPATHWWQTQLSSLKRFSTDCQAAQSLHWWSIARWISPRLDFGFSRPITDHPLKVLVFDDFVSSGCAKSIDF